MLQQNIIKTNVGNPKIIEHNTIISRHSVAINTRKWKYAKQKIANSALRRPKCQGDYLVVNFGCEDELRNIC